MLFLTQQINNVNVEDTTIDRAIDLIQSKKRLLLLVEKKALQRVVVCMSSKFLISTAFQPKTEANLTSFFCIPLRSLFLHPNHQFSSCLSL